ncbi:hypothetical protein GGX14DRAFT_403192 [Mycena pura]|uniref:Uncharacterized protein n=1 Tax=Mycena pura TaxID=153505 RepID=A0AAD6UWX5_9AGAR|nr:hypothetical protein GGX14DRAFT_403192 [Mycena pura]
MTGWRAWTGVKYTVSHMCIRQHADIFEPPLLPVFPGFGPTPPSPLSESEAEANSPCAHCLRLAKVMRALGDRIPPALVATAPPARATRRRRPSTRTVAEPEAALEQGDAPVAVPARPAQKRPSFRAEAFIDMMPDPTPTAPESAVTTRRIRAVAPARSRAPIPAARPDSTAFATLGVPVPTTHEERHGHSGPFVTTAHRIPQPQPPPYATQAELEDGPRLVQRRENSWTYAETKYFRHAS